MVSVVSAISVGTMLERDTGNTAFGPVQSIWGQKTPDIFPYNWQPHQALRRKLIHR